MGGESWLRAREGAREEAKRETGKREREEGVPSVADDVESCRERERERETKGSKRRESQGRGEVILLGRSRGRGKGVVPLAFGTIGSHRERGVPSEVEGTT